MFYSIRGKLLLIGQSFVAIECGGVGYRCYTSINTQNSLPQIGNEAMLYTHLVVREDAMELYGFATENELECFKLLITVSGVGSKMAISILSVLTVEQLVIAVASSDINAISRAQGVGKKKAERIVLDLKDKIKAFDNVLPSSGFTNNTISAMPIATGNISQTIEALAVLGFTANEVTPLLEKMDSTQPVEKLISAVLKEIGRR